MIRRTLILCLLSSSCFAAQRDAIIFCGWEWGKPSSSSFAAEVLQNSTSSAGTTSVVTSPVVTGTYAQRCNPTTTAVGHVAFVGIQTDAGGVDFGGGGDNQCVNNEIWGQFRFRYATKPSTGEEPIMMVSRQNNRSQQTDAIIALMLRSDGKLEVQDNNGTTLGSVGSTVLSADTWYRIDFRSRSDTTSAWEIKINGTTEISNTGDTMQTPLRMVLLGKTFNNSSQTVDFFYDDFAVSNDGYFDAAIAVEILTPDANGTDTGLTGDYTDVDEVPPDEGTSVLTGTSIAKESVNLSAMPAADDIHSVKAMWYGDQASVDDDRQLDAYLISGATTPSIDIDRFANNGTWTIGWEMSDTDRNCQQYVWNQNPNGGADWTEAAVNALEIGIEGNDSGKNVRISAMAVCVLYTPTAAPTAVQGSQIQQVF